MRALRVVGLGEDGKTVICEDPARGERFELPADERLRAAARGDATRLGQIETDLESQMRPREIQTRIRSGESVAQVAAAAGVPEHRIERFAYPVLLERSRIAELAQRAHPVREDGPDVQTLGEVVAHSFGLRGQDYSDTTWDAWKGEDGKWVVQLRWAAGRSDNSAHWSFHPGAHGGTVAALDEHSMDLLDPNPNRQLRTVRPVTELARQALTVDSDPRGRQAVGAVEPVRQEAPPEPTYREPAYREPEYRQPENRQPEPEPAVGLTEQPVEPAPQQPATQQPVAHPPAPPAQPAAPVAEPEPAAAAPEPQQPLAAPEPVEEPVATVEAATVEEPKAEPEPRAETTPEPTVETTPEPKVEAKPKPAAAAKPEPKPEAKPESEAETPPEPKPKAEPPKTETKPKPPTRRKGKKNHPVVPSWEDVLLGTRSHRG